MTALVRLEKLGAPDVGVATPLPCLRWSGGRQDEEGDELLVQGGKGGGEHSRFGETAFVGEPVGRGLRAGRAAHTRLCLCMQTWRLLRRKQQGPLSRLATRLSGHGGGKKQTHRLRAILGG